MFLLVSQAVLFSHQHDIAQEYAQHAQAAQTSAPVKRLSAFAADISKSFTEYWHLPANDPHVRAEISLFPKRMML
jgi:hypothetical protein